jgi:transcriptional regulator with XRE-family HTH domain
VGRREEIAEQLRALMRRHGISAMEIERRTAAAGHKVSVVTIYRILQLRNEAEPEHGTLRRIAECLGETTSTAFPEEEPGTIVDVSNRANRLFYRFLGAPPPPGFEAELKALIARYEQKAAAVKEPHRTTVQHGEKPIRRGRGS